MFPRRATIAVAGLFVLLAGSSAAGRDGPADALAIQDLAYREVLFYFFQEDHFTALTRLLAARGRGSLAPHEQDAELVLGSLYLSYGEYRLAGEIFQRVLERSAEPGMRDRAWFWLAKSWYRRGNLPECEAALARIGAELPEPLESERHMLRAETLMGQNRFEEALLALRSWPNPRGEWIGYAKYNIGVALVRLGRVDEGARVLDEVGRLEPGSVEVEALRDKANLALGYAWLQAQSPERAKPALQRVRLEGPYSNKALLGVGWADAESDRYESALASWTELRGRSLLDSAVQESLLAVPYAFARLGAEKQAADYYLDAIAAFDEEIARVTSSIDAVGRREFATGLLGRQTGARAGYWRLDEISDSAESHYLYELMATHRFQEGLADYRDLSFVDRNLRSWGDSLGAFDDILDTGRRAYRQRVPVIDANLRVMDLDGIDARRAELEPRLTAIERAEDVVALGTPEQQEQWRRLDAMEPELERLRGRADTEGLADKQRLLKGLLLWDLSRDYKVRLRAQQTGLRDLDAALEEARRRYERVEAARTDWPQRSAGFAARVDALRPRLLGLQVAVGKALTQQQAYLRQIALEELDARRGRLGSYLAQARFALASVYDRAAALREPGAELPLADSSR